MRTHIQINGRSIGPGYPVYVIAELSGNHGQDFDHALELIKTAKDAGADAVKLQTYTPETLTIDSNRDYFRITGGTPWDGHTLYDLYRQAHTPWEWQGELKTAAEALGLDAFSTAFDASSVDFLDHLGMPACKVASFEITDLPLIDKIARTGKPMILSTGMATLGEIDDAVRTARQAGAKQIVLLKCTSAYPAPADEIHLRTIPHMAEAFRLPVGLSDHTLGIGVPVAAVALGACVVEKHLTRSRATPGPDSTFSSEPHEFKAMVEAIRQAEMAMGCVQYAPGEQEAKNRQFRRSLFVVKDVRAGEVLTSDHVRCIRPAHGLPPKFLSTVLGKRVTVDLERGTPLTWEMVTASAQVDAIPPSASSLTPAPHS